MIFYEMFHAFEKLAFPNEKTAINRLHFSLDFDPTEKAIDKKLSAMPDDYIKRIGLGINLILFTAF